MGKKNNIGYIIIHSQRENTGMVKKHYIGMYGMYLYEAEIDDSPKRVNRTQRLIC